MAYVIADIGSNWTDLESAKKLIMEAASCGISAVKFQLFKQEELYPEWSKVDISKYELPEEWLPELQNKAIRCNMDFMCSAFSERALDIVNLYVTKHKVAGSEATNIRFLDKVFSYRKHVFVSIGRIEPYLMRLDVYKYLKEIQDENCPLTVLHCVQDYPTSDLGVNLACIQTLKEDFRSYGISDHTTNFIEIPYMAAALDCIFYEKHFKGSSQAKTPDSPHSLNCNQMRCYIDNINFAEKIMWTPRRDNFIERKIVAIKDINVGDRLKLGENIAILRNDTGKSAWFINDFDGFVSKERVKQGEGVGCVKREEEKR